MDVHKNKMSNAQHLETVFSLEENFTLSKYLF